MTISAIGDTRRVVSRLCGDSQLGIACAVGIPDRPVVIACGPVCGGAPLESGRMAQQGYREPHVECGRRWRRSASAGRDLTREPRGPPLHEVICDAVALGTSGVYSPLCSIAAPVHRTDDIEWAGASMVPLLCAAHGRSG